MPENPLPKSEVRLRPPRPSLEDQFPAHSSQERDPSLETPRETVNQTEMLGKIALGESVFTEEQPFSEFYNELLEENGHTERTAMPRQSAGEYLESSKLGAPEYPETHQINDTKAPGATPAFLPPIELQPQDPVVEAFLNGEPNPIAPVRSIARDNVTKAFLGETHTSREYTFSRRSIPEIALTGLKRWVTKRFGNTKRSRPPEDPFKERPVYGNGLDEEPTEFVSPYKVK